MDDNNPYKDDIVAQMLAKKFGSVSKEEMDERMKNRKEAVDMAMGMMGTVAPVSKFGGIAKVLGNEAPAVEAGLADKIKQAALHSKVRGPEGGLVSHNNPLTAAERAEAYGTVTGPEGGLTNNTSQFQKEFNPETDQNLMRLKRLREMLSGK